MRKSQKASRHDAAKSTKRGFMRGDSGRDNVDAELKKSAARKEKRDHDRNMPFRFRMKAGEEGREIVILDDAPDFFMYEHTLQDPDTGWWNLHLSCCQTFDTCAVCEAQSKDIPAASYNMVLTALDLQEYVTRNKDVIPYSRKLYIVKSKQHKKFLRLFEKKGSLRGARFVLARDGDKDPVIGSDIEFDGFMDEDELQEYVREYTNREGKKIVEDCSVAYDYEDIFDEPDPELLREAVGAEPPPGSKRANEDEPVKARKSRRDDDDEEFTEDDDDGSDVPWEEEEDDEQDEKDESVDDDDEVDEEEDDEEEAEEEEPEEEEEEPAPKRKKRTSSASKRGREKASPKARPSRRSARR